MFVDTESFPQPSPPALPLPAFTSVQLTSLGISPPANRGTATNNGRCEKGKVARILDWVLGLELEVAPRMEDPCCGRGGADLRVNTKWGKERERGKSSAAEDADCLAGALRVCCVPVLSGVSLSPLPFDPSPGKCCFPASLLAANTYRAPHMFLGRHLFAKSAVLPQLSRGLPRAVWASRPPTCGAWHAYQPPGGTALPRFRHGTAGQNSLLSSGRSSQWERNFSGTESVNLTSAEVYLEKWFSARLDLYERMFTIGAVMTFGNLSLSEKRASLVT